jgi:NAD(P)H-hydrate epimerase
MYNCQSMDKKLIEESIQQLSHAAALSSVTSVTESMVRQFIKPRDPQSYKGDYGHALLYAGSLGMAGAAVLASRACLRSGVGLLTVCTPSCNNVILQVSVPEAMTVSDDDMYANTLLERYKAIGAGPGLGQGAAQAALLGRLMRSASCPMVLDADALNIMSQERSLMEAIPAGSVITPHPGELKRLVGNTSGRKELIEKAALLAAEYGITVVVKGAPTVTVSPSGTAYVNTTGNPGMATGGSGDVLTGITLALLAQGLDQDQAAITAVYIHGLAGDAAAAQYGMTAMTSADIAGCLPQVWQQTEKTI